MADEVVAKRIADLTETSQAIVESYHQWAKAKRTTTLKELEYEFSRYQKTMLKEGVLSQKEVATLLSSFFTALQGSIQRGLAFQGYSSCEHLAQLLSCAGAKGVNLNPPRVAGSLGNESSAPSFLLKEPLGAKPKLASLDAATASDAKLKEELHGVERENDRLREKISRITNQFQEMMQMKAEVGQSLLEAQAEVGTLKEKYGGGPDPVEVAKMQQQIDHLKKENEAAKKQLAAKLNESPQFSNLKKMLIKKNEELARLRQMLKEHELVFESETAEEEVLLND